MGTVSMDRFAALSRVPPYGPLFLFQTANEAWIATDREEKLCRGLGMHMVCLIKQDGAEIIGWFMGPTVEDVARQCKDESLSRELLTLWRLAPPGMYRLQGGRYALLVGDAGTRQD